MNQEVPDVQAGFRKGRGTRDQIANIRWVIEKTREFQKDIYLHFIDYSKAFDCVGYDKLWKALEEMGIPILPASWETCMPVKKKQLEPCMEQLIGSRLRKEYKRAVCYHPVCLTYTLTAWEMLSWMSYKLESVWVGEASTTSDMRMILLLIAESEEELKSLLMKEPAWNEILKEN